MARHLQDDPITVSEAEGESKIGSHIFLASESNFRRCLERGIYGGIAHGFERTNSEIIAGFHAIKPGDLVFFYVKNVGLYGLWKITSAPFYDETPVWGQSDQSYPYRVCFEPTVRAFPKPIALSDILDLRDKGKIWTFDLATFNRKSHHPITLDEEKELLRLLLRNNPVFCPTISIPSPYPQGNTNLPLNLDTDNRGRINFEGYLNAWFMRSFVQGKLKELIGEYSDFINFVPTSFNKVMDVFLTHITEIDSVSILHKFTCMELKTGACTEEDLNQILKYENWLIRKLADGDSEMIQSILVGFSFSEKVLEYVRSRRQIEEKTVRLLEYRVTKTRDDIELIEVQP